MQPQKVMRLDGEGGVGPTTVIAELHFENVGTENLHNGAHLSANQTGFGHVAHQSDNGKEFEISHAPSFLWYITACQSGKAVIRHYNGSLTWSDLVCESQFHERSDGNNPSVAELSNPQQILANGPLECFVHLGLPGKYAR